MRHEEKREGIHRFGTGRLFGERHAASPNCSINDICLYGYVHTVKIIPLELCAVDRPQPDSGLGQTGEQV